MPEEKRFTVELQDDFIMLKTWGKLDIKDLEAPANAALALAQEKNIRKLLDDIQDIDTTNVSIPIQSKAMGILWKLRTFDKVAIVFKSKEVGLLFLKTLQAIHLGSKFRGFDNVTDATMWLKEQ